VGDGALRRERLRGDTMTSGASSGYGSGVKQRNQVAMTPEEVDDFLRARRTLSVASINPDGSIHLVAMWYGFLEGAVAFTSKAKAQKVLNLRRNPHITVMAEDGEAYDELVGVSIVGTAEIVEDPERMFEVGKSVFERHGGGPFTEDRRPVVEANLRKRVVVKVIPQRVVSWDHRKL
jgi:PPOX class probable F420-dependent enzyme